MMEYRSTWMEQGICALENQAPGQRLYSAEAPVQNRELHNWYRLETCCNCDVPARRSALSRPARIRNVFPAQAGRPGTAKKNVLSPQLPLAK